MTAQTTSAQSNNNRYSRYKNNFRTGLGFAYILDDDNSGALFSNQYTRELSDKVNFSVALEYLSSSRYDKNRMVFTSRKAFIMLDASLYYDLLENGKSAVKIGIGPAVRRRSELDLQSNAVVNNGQTSTEAYISNRTKDFGGKIVLENDFYNDNRLFFGMRAAGYIYNEGPSIFSVGLSMGYSF